MNYLKSIYSIILVLFVFSSASDLIEGEYDISQVLKKAGNSTIASIDSVPLDLQGNYVVALWGEPGALKECLTREIVTIDATTITVSANTRNIHQFYRSKTAKNLPGLSGIVITLYQAKKYNDQMDHFIFSFRKITGKELSKVGQWHMELQHIKPDGSKGSFNWIIKREQ